MNHIHVSGLDIQQYALHPLQCEQHIITHIRTCEYCSSLLDVYTSIFIPIKEMPSPSFDFDVYGLVLPTIRPQKAKRLFPIVPLLIILAFAVALVSFTLVLLSKNHLLTLLKDSGHYLMNYTLIGGGILIATFHVADQVLRLKEQVKEFHLE